MSNHCIDVTCPVCGREYDARLWMGCCPRCGHDYCEKSVTLSSGGFRTFAAHKRNILSF